MRLAALALLSVLAATPSFAAGPAPTPVDHQPGQQATACKGDLGFTFTVVSADLRRAVARRAAPAGKLWAVVVADVTNRGARADAVQGLISVRDQQGRKSDWRLFNGTEIGVENALAEELGLKASWELVDAGGTERFAAIFLVDEQTRSLQILGNRVGCFRQATR